MQSSEDRSLTAARSSIHRLTVSEAATARRDMLHPCQPSWARTGSSRQNIFLLRRSRQVHARHDIALQRTLWSGLDYQLECGVLCEL
jgi:hypothetical protein